MRVEWKTVHSIEHFESMNCLDIIGRSTVERFTQVINLAKGYTVIPHDLTFATSFLVTVLFLKVKGSRPMTFQFLTVEMMRSAFDKGIIDQKHFKTELKYGFDSLIFSDYVLEKIKMYMEFVRPKLNPTCNFLFICKNGSQLANFGDVFGRMTYQAIGKYVNPTRYRQIIETESSDLLSVEEQGVISLDQKHTSNVAKVHYQKKRSRSVAQKAMDCMEKLINNSRSTTEEQSSDHSLRSGQDEDMETSSVEYSIIEPSRKTIKNTF